MTGQERLPSPGDAPARLEAWPSEKATTNNRLEAEVVRRLAERGAMLATVESCTGGLIAKRITDVPGSSAVFWGSWVTYANSAKLALGVDPALIEAYGAVSAEVAAAMARAGLAAMRAADPALRTAVCLSTTGIAGPGGATATKRVGLSFVAVVGDEGETEVAEVHAPGGLERERNRAWFADEALALLLRRLT